MAESKNNGRSSNSAEIPHLVDHLFRRKAGQMVAALTRLFGPDVLDDAALTLQAGKTVGPIQWDSSTATREVWIHLANIEDRSVDLYDVQLAIYDQLFAQRLNEVQAEYFTELISRGSLSNIEDMQQRLFRIAAERYLIANLPARTPEQQ